jgi:hypothetical protein
MQDMRGVRLSRAVLSRDDLGESSDRHFWVVDEVRVAVQHGYNVLKIHEFYDYEVTQYDPKTGGGGHFVQYIDTFLKVKAEASSYPGWVQGTEDENRYVKYIRESEGIELDKALIQKNAAKRGLAKLPQFVLGQIDGIK